MKNATTIVTIAVATITVCALVSFSYAVYKGRDANHKEFATHTDVISLCARGAWTVDITLLKPCIQVGFRRIERRHHAIETQLIGSELEKNFEELRRNNDEIHALAKRYLE